jgi:hypothetical protein
MKAIRLIILSIALFSLALSACAKKQVGETAEQIKARKPAVYTAQAFVGVNAWSDLTESLARNKVIGLQAARASYLENERTRKALDIFSDRLQGLETTDLVTRIRNVYPQLTEEQARKITPIEIADLLIEDLQRAERANVLPVSNYRSVLVTMRLGIVAIKNVLANKSETAQQKGIQEALPELITISQDMLIALNNLSGATAKFAWEEARRLSAEIASKNTARLG